MLLETIALGEKGLMARYRMILFTALPWISLGVHFREIMAGCERYPSIDSLDRSGDFCPLIISRLLLLLLNVYLVRTL